MTTRKKPPLGTLWRRATSLLAAFSFLVMAVTGVLAFVRPFSIGITGLHTLMGFVFIVVIGMHVVNNSRPFTSYLKSNTLWSAIVFTGVLTSLFWWQPAPIRTILGWSSNLGPDKERFEMRADAMVFDYLPSPDYQMRLTIKTGPAYQADRPPQLAVWLENQGGYHIKTLLAPVAGSELPYWAFKHAGWEKARKEAVENDKIDAVSSPTPNGSFDPADYILPRPSKDSTPYQLLFEINQTEDGQASLVYAVEIDNALPRAFQLLDLRGYPKREENKSTDKETWSLYYVDDSFGSALGLIDSALLTIERAK